MLLIPSMVYYILAGCMFFLCDMFMLATTSRPGAL